MSNITIEQVRKIFQDPEFLKTYDAWRKDSVTQRVFQAAALLATPLPLTKPTPETALYQYAELVGMQRILSFLDGADKVMEEATRAEVEATYGLSRFSDTSPEFEAARRRIEARRGKPATAPAAQ